MPNVTVRPFAAPDRDAARALLGAELPHNPYGARALELIEAVTPDGEYRALVAEHDGATVGVAVYGIVAGTRGAGSVYAVVVDPAHRHAGLGRALVDAAAAALAALGARFALVEVPDDPAAVAGVTELVRAGGFVETARVSDLYRDGVALAFWQRPL
jgi:ribosomal protein S18 acetylase RimI-like enzyme